MSENSWLVQRFTYAYARHFHSTVVISQQSSHDCDLAKQRQWFYTKSLFLLLIGYFHLIDRNADFHENPHLY